MADVLVHQRACRDDDLKLVVEGDQPEVVVRRQAVDEVSERVLTTSRGPLPMEPLRSRTTCKGCGGRVAAAVSSRGEAMSIRTGTRSLTRWLTG